MSERILTVKQVVEQHERNEQTLTGEREDQRERAERAESELAEARKLLCARCGGKGTIVKDGPHDEEYDSHFPCPDCSRPLNAEIEAAAKAIAPFVPDGNWRTDLAAKEAARAALRAARGVRCQ